jgi:hypothetical protein
MIVDYEYLNKQLVVSYINEYGNIKLMYIPWDNPKKFVTCAKSDSDQHESYQTWPPVMSWEELISM